MKRHLVILTLAGVFGVFLTATEAKACHLPKCKSTPCVAAAPVPTCLRWPPAKPAAC